MKLIKLLLTGSCLTLALTTLSHAQTVIRITGSTAYRGATISAIGKIFDSNTFTSGYVGATPDGAAANFRGLVNGTDVLIKTSFSGSEGGIQTVSFGADPLTVKFLPDSTALTAGTPGANPGSLPTGGTSGKPNPQTSANAADFAAEIPQIAMSDSFQSSSVFKGLYKGKTYPTLAESPNSPVGVVPFTFVASKSAPASMTNITSQLARNLFSAGRVRYSLFTGVASDDTNVLATGRDPDSGTRLTALAEVGLGGAFAVKQYQPSDGSGVALKTAGGAVADARPWPASTVNTIAIDTFQGGYSSGGDLRLALGNTTDLDTLPILNAQGNATSFAGGFFVSYLSTGDAKTAVTNGAKYVGYNGVNLYPGGLTTAADPNLTPIYQGQYTFWGYEHLYYRSDASATTKAVGDKLALQLKNTDATVLLTNMAVTRATDGATVQ